MAQATADLAHPDGGPAQFNDAGLTMAYAPDANVSTFSPSCSTEPRSRAGLRLSRRRLFRPARRRRLFRRRLRPHRPRRAARPCAWRHPLVRAEPRAASASSSIPASTNISTAPRRRAARAAAVAQHAVFRRARPGRVLRRLPLRPPARTSTVLRTASANPTASSSKARTTAIGRHDARPPLRADERRVCASSTASPGRRGAARIGFLLHPEVEVALGGRRRAFSTRGGARRRGFARASTSPAKTPSGGPTWATSAPTKRLLSDARAGRRAKSQANSSGPTFKGGEA